MPRLTKSDRTERVSLYMLPSILELIDASAEKNKRSRTQEVNLIVEQYFAAQDNKKESVTSTLSERS